MFNVVLKYIDKMNDFSIYYITIDENYNCLENLTMILNWINKNKNIEDTISSNAFRFIHLRVKSSEQTIEKLKRELPHCFKSILTEKQLYIYIYRAKRAYNRFKIIEL